MISNPKSLLKDSKVSYACVYSLYDYYYRTIDLCLMLGIQCTCNQVRNKRVNQTYMYISEVNSNFYEGIHPIDYVICQFNNMPNNTYINFI